MPDLAPIRFSVIKYVADPLRDEPINVGVVAQIDDRLELRHTPSFARIRRLTGVEDTSVIEIALRFLRSALDREPHFPLERLINESFGVIRFSDILGGLTDDPGAFLDEQYDIYVRDNAPVRSITIESRTNIRARLRKAISQQGHDAEPYAIWRKRFHGATGRHEFDFGFKNGKISLIRAISLQTQEAYALNDARALSFASLDSKALDHSIEITAVVAPPNESNSGYEEAFGLVRTHADKLVILDSNNAVDDVIREIFSHDLDVQPITQALLTDPTIS